MDLKLDACFTLMWMDAELSTSNGPGKILSYHEEPEFYQDPKDFYARLSQSRKSLQDYSKGFLGLGIEKAAGLGNILKAEL